MELLDFRDELRDIWLWLGDDDGLLVRSPEAPAPTTAVAAPTRAVPGCVTVTIGCTDAPMLPKIILIAFTC